MINFFSAPSEGRKKLSWTLRYYLRLSDMQSTFDINQVLAMWPTRTLQLFNPDMAWVASQKKHRSSKIFGGMVRAFHGKLWIFWKISLKLLVFSVQMLPICQLLVKAYDGILTFRSCQFFLQFSQLEVYLLSSRFDEGLRPIIKEMMFWILDVVFCSSHCFATSELIDSHTHTHKSHDPWRWRFPLQASQVAMLSCTVLLLQFCLGPLERSRQVCQSCLVNQELTTLSTVQWSWQIQVPGEQKKTEATMRDMTDAHGSVNGLELP